MLTLLSQVYFKAPIPVSTTSSPKQITDFDAVEITSGKGLTIITIESVLLHPSRSVTFTLYFLVSFGVNTIPSNTLLSHSNLYLTLFVILVLNVTLSPKQILDLLVNVEYLLRDLTAILKKFVL